MLTTGHPCDRKDTFLQSHPLASLTRTAWGSGEELQISASGSTNGAEESYFFDEDGLMVGAVFIFRNGLSLKPYPVLRQTISLLKPDTEFYLSGANLADHENLNSGTLYLTGDEKSTTQYVISGEGSGQTLVIASFSIDPYVTLLSPYPEFVSRLGNGQAKGSLIAGKKKDAKEPFPSLQQFARGQTAQLGYCDSKEYEKAAEAYRKALSLGFTDKVWIAEAHHRLGVALEGQGQLNQAREEMEQSLIVRPNTPEVLNNLGTVYMKLKQRDKAVKVLEKAVLLRPNYPLARYNLAESYEETNTKRAIGEYETYLALVDGIPEEAERMAQVKERIKALRR
ncbi:MAG: tetratricopeptide repeat protein [Nitrospirota bacterium]|nr:tetratricopeptide repeat protein [Nitrospirota bacterium]